VNKGTSVKGIGMTATMEMLLLLLGVLAVVAVLARRLRIAPSILMVLAGLGLAFVPGLPSLELAPELVLFGILPPLIYSAGVAMSWREFRFNLRAIILFAFGGVIFTACAIAFAAHYLFGMPAAAAFVLGAIVAPPDTVAPLAIARRLGIPRRLIVVLEGEGLANDATALILYRFAVVAVSTGLFNLPQAMGSFVLIVAGELAFGVALGWASLRLRRWVRDPRVEITLSVMTPYAAFWIPEQFGGSGVLATVAAGLFVSWNGPLLIPAATRLQGIFFWDLVVYLLEGFIFLVMGLQARTILYRTDDFILTDLGLSLLLVVAVAIGARFIWVFPAVYVPRWLSPSLARRDPTPPWQWSFILAFVGVRGVVSLAAALAIPLTTAAGTPFPYRNFILAVTFGVIIVTFVGQGALLPSVVRWLGLASDTAAEREREHEAEREARWKALDAAWRRLSELETGGRVPKAVLEALQLRHRYRAGRLPTSSQGDVERLSASAEFRTELIGVEREFIYGLLQDGKITDESRRRIERELDLEEASIACKKEGGVDLPL
jgi:monovalent cation/hydrogen antiporter